MSTEDTGAALEGEPALTAVETVDTTFLETLIGYNARRTALVAIESFLRVLEPLRLKPVEFSVLSLIEHNPGITQRQLCAALNILPPNLVGLIQRQERRGFIEKKPHPRDGRASGLYTTDEGRSFVARAEELVAALEARLVARLSPSEQRTLLQLLQRVYRSPSV